MTRLDVLRKYVHEIPTKIHDRYHAPVGFAHPNSAHIDDIVGFLASSGVTQGSTLFVHSSWDRLGNGLFSAKDLILAMLDIVGPSGTLAMPAFPAPGSCHEFDVRKTPSAAGLLTEAFRRFPGVSRSININHSVCAIGPQAEFLVSDHHRCITAWDEYSPYYRLGSIGNAYIVGLGVGWRLKIATSLHCADSILRQSVPFFSKLFKSTLKYTYVDANGNRGEHEILLRSGIIYTPKLAKHFNSSELKEECVNGLDVYSIKADVLINKAIELGRRGDTMYVYPVPFPHLFRMK